MPKFPEPPHASILAEIAPDLHILHAGTRLWRLYNRGGPYHGAWNKFRDYGPLPTARFDHHVSPPRVQDRKILYAATLGPTCIAEVFQAGRAIDRVAGNPWLAGFTIERDIALLDLTGVWPTRAGASMALNTGPRPRARRWSAAIYDAYPHIDGLWYPSSMYGGKRAVALYERIEGALSAAPFFHLPLSAPALYIPLRHVAEDVGYALL
jgi:hypothetical protein